MKRFSIIIILLLAVFAAAPSQTVWKSDQSHSNLQFSVTHMVISDVTGRFNEFSAEMATEKEDFSDASLHVTVKVGSINTNNERRDNHLRSSDFFEAEKFPEATFTSTSFKKTGEMKYTIIGDLTIRDTTKSITLEAKLRGMIKDQRGGLRSGFKATGTISRKDFGIEWNRALETGGWLVGDDVDLIINTELVQEVSAEKK